MSEAQLDEQMRSAVDREVAGQSGRFLEGLAERLGGAAGAAAVYGMPVEREGVTVIPVAKARWGFGGGRGSGGGADSGTGSGEGGGGGMAVSPLGYIEIANGQAEFKRIKDPAALLPLAPFIFATGMSIFLILAGVRRLIRQ